MSYSLFPPAPDYSKYLADVPKKTTTTATQATAPEGSTATQPVNTTTQETEPQTSSKHIERGRDSTTKERSVEGQSQKKRKRAPSPNVIPNPKGASYGMDLDYFGVDSDDEEELASAPAPAPAPRTEPRSTLSRTALRGAAQTERPASKKVRFDASPDDTPSKYRARATDPYTGRHFIGMGAPQAASEPTSPAPTPSTPTPDPSTLTPDERSRLLRLRPGFRPNRSGTFQLDYDAFSDDSDEDDDTGDVSSPPNIPASSTLPQTTPSAQPVAQRYGPTALTSKLLTDFLVPHRPLLALLLDLHSRHSLLNPLNQLSLLSLLNPLRPLNPQ